ncbi:rhamnogalacturonan acetylesterase [Uliginosibacterium sp. 31-12]|uniref:rhamnogalacturonan acetylesterase n=1 Tax=Uliginosibacterium sp. 31-12 TaxID=3062781 RepID=UPI0026E216B5|nr:rhamnogalacturonan acetylesterase [Uliginosibacterium sp. 31-12]MDO6385789.1 rhamnogalacturonan acetylesterase [Uliginosibacterium sp. 31-12]
MNLNLRLSIVAMIGASLIGCASNAPTQAPAASPAAAQSAVKPLAGVTLSGVAGAGQQKFTVTAYDAQGNRKSVTSDDKGAYSLSADGLVAPLMLVAEAGRTQFVSLIAEPAGKVTANINALTDFIASGAAKEAKFQGPAGMVQSGKAPAVKAEALKSKASSLQPLLGSALKEAGVSDAANFDPASGNAGEVLKYIRHNRGYLSSQGVLGETSLFDSNYHEITKLSPLSMAHARAEAQAIAAPGVTRIFIAGDSTASNYDVDVTPRNGWGQIFERQLKDAKQVQVVNVAQSGRSSRSFITEGWFDMIKADIRKGDYLLVQFGHNDEKCGEEPPRPAPARDVIDIANLCTYPGTAAGVPAEMGFQKTLEKYIAIAKDAGATPVLITPVTRRQFKDGKIGGTTHTWGKGKVPGDYSQTIRDTAKANKVALVDLDQKSMDFFNKLGEAESLNYYLAVDPAKYPYYATQTGSRTKPDNTHFQEKGAEAIGGLVAQGLKEAKLPIASQLK